MANKKKAAVVAAKKPKEMLLVQSKVKEYIRAQDKQCASDLIEALNDRVAQILDEAVKRAAENGRKPARSYDV